MDWVTPRKAKKPQRHTAMNQRGTSVMAMATVVKHLLNDAPPDRREAVLTAAHSMIARDLAADVPMSPRHTPQIMSEIIELKARAIYCFAREAVAEAASATSAGQKQARKGQPSRAQSPERQPHAIVSAPPCVRLGLESELIRPSAADYPPPRRSRVRRKIWGWE
jgi:hypothetical protein